MIMAAHGAKRYFYNISQAHEDIGLCKRVTFSLAYWQINSLCYAQKAQGVYLMSKLLILLLLIVILLFSLIQYVLA